MRGRRVLLFLSLANQGIWCLWPAGVESQACWESNRRRITLSNMHSFQCWIITAGSAVVASDEAVVFKKQIVSGCFLITRIKTSDNNNMVFMHYAAGEGGYSEKKWKISSYSHSNPLKRALLPVTAKHFDTSLLKITGKKGWNRVILRGFRKRGRFAVISHLFSAWKKIKLSILEVMKLVRKKEIAQSSYWWQSWKSSSFNMLDTEKVLKAFLNCFALLLIIWLH